jgi:alpha-glucoside transport system substrate-binding protein
LKTLLALLFAFALTAGACSGDEAADTDAGTDTTAAGEESTDTTAAEEESTDTTAAGEEAMGEMEADTGTVTITGPERDESEAGAIQEVLSAWGAENGIEVTYVGSADWESEINVAVEAGNTPDISFFPQPGKLADFYNAGSVMALPEETAAAVAANWDESWLAFGNVDGTQVGVPAKSDLKSLVWFKPARFEELGYAIPETWDELKALTETAIADGNTPWCVGIESGTATGWPFTDWVEDLMLRYHGADVYDQWVANEVKFSDERVVQVFDEIRNLWTLDGATFASGGSISATAFGDNGQGLVDDDCLMHRQASFFSAFIPEGTPFADGSAEAVDVFYFPSVDGSRPVLGAGVLAGAFHNRAEVWAVMEYLGSPEYANARQAAQKELKGGGDALSGFLSAVKGADPSLYAPLEQSMLEVLATGEVVRFDGSDLMPGDVGAGTFWSEGTSFINGDIDAATATANIDASWPS